MRELSVRELTRIINAKLDTRDSTPAARAESSSRGGDAETGHRITAVSTDSRTIRPGDCFFAIRGERFNGHDYIHDVFAKGAACVVVNRDFRTPAPLPAYRVLKVENTVEALGKLAAEYRRKAGYRVVAVTGSVGKTTTRQIIHHVLKRRFRVFQSPKSFNNHLGLPLTLLGAEPEDEIVIAEVGANHPGEIANLTNIAGPDIAVVTNVHPAHLEGFGSIEEIAREKLSISEGLSNHGTLILNADCDYLTNARRTNPLQAVRITTFGRCDNADYRGRDVLMHGTGSEFTISGNTRVFLPLAGPGNVENALAAWAVCDQFGIAAEDFAGAVETMPNVPMRAEPIYIGTLNVLNDCYNANPASMNNALVTVAQLRQSLKRADGSAGRLVFICGDMGELGDYAERFHAELGVSAVQAGVQLLLGVGRFAETVSRAAGEAAEYDLQAECFEDTDALCNRLEDFIEDYDIILVKGSRVVGLEQTVEKLKELFSARHRGRPRGKSVRIVQRTPDSRSERQVADSPQASRGITG